MIHIKPFVSAILWTVVCISAAAADPDIELIRKRFANAAMKPASSIDIGYIKDRMDSLQDDGSWPDINYTDLRREAFQNSRHLDHLVAMAQAYKAPGCPLEGSKVLKKKIFSAIDYWTANDFQSDNWWDNEIGTTGKMLKLLYLMDKELGKDRSGRMCNIALRANMKASGARPGGDRLKEASLYSQVRLWQRDEEEVVKMLSLICSEMRYYDQQSFERILKENPQYLDGGKGLQADFSFHHRMDRVNNTLTYGEGFASAFIDWADKVKDTKYRFGEEYVRLLVDFYLDGMCKQMAFGLQTDPGVMNREMTSPGNGRKVAESTIPEALLGLTDYRKDDIQAILDLRCGRDAVPSSFAKTFFNSEYFVFQRPSFYTSVRMYSTRNASMEEPYNGQGLLNHFRGDGANYLTIDGDEYASIYPSFDFRKVPGATIKMSDTMPDEDRIKQIGLTDFVGGVDDGLYGAAAFDFISPLDVVSAKKSWFFFDDSYLCLGAGIACSGPGIIFTTVNQCLLDGPVTVACGDVRRVLEPGKSRFEGISWVHHDGVGYVFPKGGDAEVLNKSVEGTWTRMNRQTSVPTRSFTNDIFCLYLDHGSNIPDGSYEYIVVPGADARATDAFSKKNDIVVLSNTAVLQAAAHMGEGVAYAAMYSAGTLRIGESISIGSETPAMMLVRFDGGRILSLTVSDPSRKCSRLHLSITSDNVNKSVAVDMPKEELGGSSVSVSLL